MKDSEQREALREAKIMQSLKHPNIIRFREVYQSEQNRLCIVMDYADGGDLQKRILLNKAKKLLFPESQILDWLGQICAGLNHVHSRKILHRDIKSQNVFINSNRCLLGDFGISRVLDSTHDYARTLVGTPYYVSPEIVENRPYRFESDIWALGVLAYELCAQKPPFDAPCISALALKIVRGDYQPIPAKYSKGLRGLVEQMLQVDPQKRPTAAQILQCELLRPHVQRGGAAEKAMCLFRAREFRLEKQRQLECCHQQREKARPATSEGTPRDNGAPGFTPFAPGEGLLIRGISYKPITQPMIRKNNGQFDRIRDRLVARKAEMQQSQNRPDMFSRDLEADIRDVVVVQTEKEPEQKPTLQSEVGATPEKTAATARAQLQTVSTNVTAERPAIADKARSASFALIEATLLPRPVERRRRKSFSEDPDVEEPEVVSEFTVEHEEEAKDDLTVARQYLESLFGKERVARVVASIRRQQQQTSPAQCMMSIEGYRREAEDCISAEELENNIGLFIAISATSPRELL